MTGPMSVEPMHNAPHQRGPENLHGAIDEGDEFGPSVAEVGDRYDLLDRFYSPPTS